MPTASKTIKFRQRRYSREGFSLGAKLGMLSAILLSLAAVTLIFLGAYVYHQITQNLPSIDLLSSLVEPPNGSFLQPTRLYDRTHQHVILTLQNPAATDKQYIKLVMSDGKIANQALQYLVNAMITIDDPEFWDEPRFGLEGISQGSQYTILQRMVDKLLLANVMPSKWRDIGERLLEYQLINKYGHLKVLEWYLNTVQYGKFIYGADAAARAYFGKTAEYLSLGEAAMLAAFEQDPSLDPFVDASSLREMQVQVIFAMLDQGLIGSDEAQEALKENIQIQPQIAPESLAPEFTNLVLEQLSQFVPLPQVYQGGFEIITSLDFELQNQVTCASQALQAHLLTHQGTETPLSGPTCAAANFLLTSSEIEANSDQSIDIGVVILNPGDGQVLAMLGDDAAEIIPTYPSQHLVGTSVSPFLYLTAFTQGMGPASLLWDIPASQASDSSDDSGEASPTNWSAYHGPTSLRTAFDYDYLGAAGNLYQQLGSDNVWQTEEKFGIRSTRDISSTQTTIEDYYSQQASLLEITKAYGILANQGFMSGQPNVANLQQNSQHLLTSSTILSISGNDGKIWLDLKKYESIPVVSPQLAFLTTQVLSDVNVHLPSTTQDSLLDIDRPIAFKTSNSINDSGTWTIGYTPQIVVGVWIDEKQAEYSQQPELAFDLWQAITKYAIQELPIRTFIEPPGISHVWVCDPSGMLASAICPSEKEELFLTGTEPTQVDTLFHKYWVDRGTGLLATIFTPADLVDEKVYMSVPSQAEEWAIQTDFPLPPENYDSFLAPPPSAEAVISNPDMLAYIRGVVNFYGVAGGDDFAYYRLQVGEGQYPQEWMQIGENSDQPVQDGLLGSWDTTGLDGYYVVELLVVKQDRRIEQAYLPVIVDNTAPNVKILAPEDQGVFVISQDEILIIQASAGDDYRVKQVEFTIDHQWIATLYEPPYVVLWPAQIGHHELKITAYDMAGNSQEESTTFLVSR